MDRLGQVGWCAAVGSEHENLFLGFADQARAFGRLEISELFVHDAILRCHVSKGRIGTS